MILFLKFESMFKNYLPHSRGDSTENKEVTSSVSSYKWQKLLSGTSGNCKD